MCNNTHFSATCQYQRLTSKHYRCIVQFAENQGRTRTELDKQSVEMFGSVAQYLSKADASAMIEHLLGRQIVIGDNLHRTGGRGISTIFRFDGVEMDLFQDPAIPATPA